MANYQLLKADIDKKVYQNGHQEITGANLNSVLNAMVTTLGAEYQFAGVATKDTNPETPDAKVFYIANGKGTYTNFGGLEVTEDEVVVLYWDSSWHKVSTGIASQEKLTELADETNELGYNVKSISAQTNNVYYYDENKILKGYFASNGNFYPSSGYYSIRVKVEANTTYTIPRAIFFVNFYNGDDHLSSYKVGDGSTQVIGNITFTTPSDCNNIAITTYYEDANPPYFATYMVWKGNTYPNYYVKPYVVPELAEKVNKNGINEVTKQNADFISVGNNLFDLANTEIKNGYIASNGNFYPSTGYHSFYVPIGAGVTFTIPYYILCVVYYNGDTLISATDVKSSEITQPSTFTTPDNCTKMALNMVDTRDLSDFMVWVGSTYPNYYERFGYYLNDIEIHGVFYGKKCIQLGDSITWYDGHQQSGVTVKGYASYLREEEMDVDNRGVSGACITNLSSYTDVCETVASIQNFADYDYCTIMAGVNDYIFGNSPIGDFAESNFNLGIFTQAYQYIIETILEQNKDIKIILGTPLRTSFKTDANTQGKYLVDYVNRIKDIAEHYALPVIDLYNISGLNKLNIPTLTIDGLHPNNEGYSLISNKLIEAVRGI